MKNNFVKAPSRQRLVELHAWWERNCFSTDQSHEFSSLAGKLFAYIAEVDPDLAREFEANNPPPPPPAPKKAGDLLSDEEAKAIVLLGGVVEPYDPTLHCDNKCLRRGACDSCPHHRLVTPPVFA